MTKKDLRSPAQRAQAKHERKQKQIQKELARTQHGKYIDDALETVATRRRKTYNKFIDNIRQARRSPHNTNDK